MGRRVDASALIAALPSLTEKERQQVRLRLQMLSSGDSVGKEDGSPSEDGELFTLFYGTLSSRLKEQGLSVLPPMSRLRVTSPKLYRSAIDGWTRIEAFVAANFPELKKRDYMKLFHLLADVLLWRLAEQEIEVTPSVVLTGIQRMPSIMKMQFPGYVEAGCMPLILKLGRPTTTREE